MFAVLLASCTAVGGLTVLAWGKLTIYRTIKARRLRELSASIAALERELEVGPDYFQRRLALAISDSYLDFDTYMEEWDRGWRERTARRYQQPTAGVRYSVLGTVPPRELPSKDDLSALGGAPPRT